MESCLYAIRTNFKRKRINLPKPSVDTGMGLERMTAVLQGTHDNYEIDHFKRIMSLSAELIKIYSNEKTGGKACGNC